MCLCVEEKNKCVGEGCLKFITFIMKKIISIVLFLSLGLVGSQAQTFAGLDMAYYPHNFAHDRKAGDKAIIRVTYCRPNKKERVVFGTLIPYGKVWRAGANESTEIKFYQDVTLQGKKVKAGTYSLFVIPNETEWTIILNSDVDNWGAYSYKEANDVLRITAPVKKTEATVENFTIQFSKNGDTNPVMRLAWDTTLVEVAITL
jgi:hypothetical protein